MNLLNNIAVPDCINCEYGCNSQKYRASINSCYGNIVAAWQAASYGSVHRVASNSLKPFWNDVLEDLKNTNFLHNLRISAGRPASEDLHNINCSCIAKYKLQLGILMIRLKIDFLQSISYN